MAEESFLQVAADFVDYHSDINRAVREVKAIEEAQTKGEFPVRVGNFIVTGPNTIRLSRHCPFVESST
jgi:hypothetical protein